MERLPVSIIIPTYNRAEFLKRVSLPSIAWQTKFPTQCIVVDDGSTDDTAAAVAEFAKDNQDLQLEYVFQKNAGVAAARNKGIALSKTDWILALDSDDALLPHALEILMSEAKRVNADIVRARTWRVIYDTGKISGIGGSTPSSVLLKKNIFDKYGPYDEDRAIVEDIDHVFRLQPLINGGVLAVPYINYPAAIYFSHEGQVTDLLGAAKLASKAGAMIHKWEHIMPKDKLGLSNMARLWRNKGVYEVLSGNRPDGLSSLGRSLKIHFSVGTTIIIACAFFGKIFFKGVVLPMRRLFASSSFKIQFMKFYITNPTVARESIKEVRRISKPD